MIVSRIVYETEHCVQTGNEYGRIDIEFNEGFEIVVWHLHYPLWYSVDVNDICKYPRNELFDICKCIITTIYMHYTPECIYRDVIHDDDDKTYEFTVDNFNDILGNKVIKQTSCDDIYAGELSIVDGSYVFTFAKPAVMPCGYS